MPAPYNSGATIYQRPGAGSGAMSAADTFAALTRQQWDDYLNVWMPYENQAIQYATDPAVVDNAVKAARSDVSQAFAQQPAMQERRLRGLGVTLEADEQRASNRAMGLAESLADVGAANVATTRTRDRQRGLMGMSTPQVQGG